MNSKIQQRTEQLRISPAGMVTLPFSVLKAIGFGEQSVSQLDVSITAGRVQLKGVDRSVPHGLRISPRGLVQLTKEAHELLSGGRKGRCRVMIEGASVHLAPLQKD